MALSYSSYLDQRGACPGPAGTDGVTGATGPRGDPGTDAGLKYYPIAESTGPSGATWPQPAVNEVRYFMAKRGPNNVTTQNPLQVNHIGYYTWINGSGPTGPTTGGYVTNLLGEFMTPVGDPGIQDVPSSVWNITLFLYSWILVAPGASGATIDGVKVFVEVYKYDNSTTTLLSSNVGNPVSINKVISDDTPYTFDLVVGDHTFITPSTGYYIFKFFAYTTATGGYITNQQVELWTEGDFLSKLVTGIPNANGNTGATGPTGPSGPTLDPSTPAGAIVYWNSTRAVGDSNLTYNSPTTGSLNFGQNGTATGPVITWTGDADTGIWHPAANTIAVSTNATEKLRMDPTGAIILTNNGTATAPTIVWSGDLDTGFWHPTANTLSISTNANERLRIDSSGNVGVGTGPTGAAKLDVGGRVRILNDGSTSTSAWGLNNTTDSLIVQHSGDYTTAGDLNKAGSIFFANGTLNYPQARIASQMTSVTPTGYSSNLIFQTNGGGSSLAERMRIHTNGNVGIGSTGPNTALDVNGVITSQRNINTTNQNLIVLADNSGGSSLTRFGLGLYGTVGATGAQTGNDFIVNTYSDTAGILTNPLLIKRSNGYIGIQNLSPTYQLDVSGSIRGSSSIRAQGSGNGYAIASIAGSSNEYGNLDMNGYFRQYAAGTSATESNKLVQFPSDSPGGTNYFMSNYVGIGTKTAAHELDVVGIIRGRGTVVYTQVANAGVGSSWTSFSSPLTVCSISYTPKQSGTVTIVLHAGAEMIFNGGSGFDGLAWDIMSGSSALQTYNINWDTNAVTGRTQGGPNSMGVGTAYTTISATTTFSIQLRRSGDDAPFYRNAYLVLQEISTAT